MTINQIFRILLGLYPAQHQVLFNAEMTTVFEAALAERRRQSGAAWVRFVISEFAGLIAGAISAWTARLFRTAGPVVATAGASVSPIGLPNDVVEAQQRVDALVSGMVDAIAHHQFEKARLYSGQERDARKQLREIRRRRGLGE
jgi:hypothetical protein